MSRTAPNNIPQDQFNARLIAIMPECIRTRSTGNDHVLRELFTLHNDRFFPPETGMHCTGCRQRVFNKLKELYEQIKAN